MGLGRSEVVIIYPELLGYPWPEGIDPIKSHETTIFRWFPYGFPMVFPWFYSGNPPYAFLRHIRHGAMGVAKPFQTLPDHNKAISTEQKNVANLGQPKENMWYHVLTADYYIYMHMYVYIYIYTYKYVYRHVYMNICICNNHPGYT